MRQPQCGQSPPHFRTALRPGRIGSDIRVDIMAWCLHVKLAQHWTSFGHRLLASSDKPIVEISRKDAFWGAVPAETGELVGCNVLGKLLTALRDELRRAPERLTQVETSAIPNFLLLGEPIRGT